MGACLSAPIQTVEFPAPSPSILGVDLIKPTDLLNVQFDVDEGHIRLYVKNISGDTVRIPDNDAMQFIVSYSPLKDVERDKYVFRFGTDQTGVFHRGLQHKYEPLRAGESRMYEIGEASDFWDLPEDERTYRIFCVILVYPTKSAGWVEKVKRRVTFRLKV
jgi:hypothetical protein